MKNFLVVDDDPINNKLCTYTIKKAFPDAEVICFQLPAEGLAHIADTYTNNEAIHHTTLFLDINMPEINGWHFLEEFSKMGEKVHQQFVIYIVSSSIDPSDKEKAKASSFVKDYLAKPLSHVTISNLAVSG